MRAILCAIALLAAPAFGQNVIPPSGATTQSSSTPAPATTTNPLTVTAEYAFSAGSGTAVTDTTGNGNNASFCSGANAPAWNAYGVLFGVGSSTNTCVTTPLTSFKSIAIAYDTYNGGPTTGTTAPSNPFNTYPTLWGATANSGMILFCGNNSAVNGNPSNLSSGGCEPASFSTTSAVNGPNSVAAQGYGQRHILVFVPGSPDAYYIDGVPLTLSISGTSSVASSAGYEFGSGYFGAANGFRGTILYSTVDQANSWTPAQVAAETAYISTKISTRPSLPQYPTQQTTRDNRLLFPGDSLWAGRAGTQVWTSLVAPAKTYTIVNSGVSGMNVHDVDWLASARWLQDANPSGRMLAIFDGASNDLCGNNYSAADTWASWLSIARQAKQYGILPVASTLISRGAGCDANFAPLNALMRAGWKQAGFVALLDMAERPEFATGGYSNTTYYQSDQTHLTGPNNACTLASGYGIFCVGATRTVNTLDGSSAAYPDVTTSNAFVASDANNYVIQTPTAAATYQLVDCSFITGTPKTVVNGSSLYVITASTTASQALSGSAMIAAGATAVFLPVLTSPTAGGCSWSRIQ